MTVDKMTTQQMAKYLQLTPKQLDSLPKDVGRTRMLDAYRRVVTVIDTHTLSLISNERSINSREDARKELISACNQKIPTWVRLYLFYPFNDDEHRINTIKRNIRWVWVRLQHGTPTGTPKNPVSIDDITDKPGPKDPHPTPEDAFINYATRQSMIGFVEQHRPLFETLRDEFSTILPGMRKNTRSTKWSYAQVFELRYLLHPNVKMYSDEITLEYLAFLGRKETSDAIDIPLSSLNGAEKSIKHSFHRLFFSKGSPAATIFVELCNTFVSQHTPSPKQSRHVSTVNPGRPAKSSTSSSSPPTPEDVSKVNAATKLVEVELLFICYVYFLNSNRDPHCPPLDLIGMVWDNSIGDTITRTV